MKFHFLLNLLLPNIIEPTIGSEQSLPDQTNTAKALKKSLDLNYELLVVGDN